ncbi:hypothetical protein ASD67_10255 [Sphingopyxis sp. Root1497]|uniref:hypothetical protein n=1 Tax=Sphingopyxis sp. Root1497 TaxID=1736474 RepID=UPI0006FAF58E|nr:hypothetical protein [Sphingopyxis sp. Root1497]KQZ64804.1 hypothetical protein ASD67_10255 [Sphingopyxis sp. Root1497]
MTTLLWLVATIGLLPLVIGMARLDGGGPRIDARGFVASVLLCALAFSLTFLVQELGLVLPKALVPGLDPILYHNDHDWSGDAPVAELLQGGGAVATLLSGLLFLWLAGRISPARPTWRLFAFWMAFQGLFQSLSQGAVGSLIAGNDVGRALAWLGAGPVAKSALLLVAVAAMALAGRALARRYPFGGDERATALQLMATLALAILLIVPFRVPREPVEVVLIPLLVHLIGSGWLVLGLATARCDVAPAPAAPAIVGPLAALVALLAIFQLVLRPGIAF